LLSQAKVILLDGAMGTQLMEKGLRAGEIPEMWNLKSPEVIEEIHLSYIKAGSQIIYTNTFGANRLKMKKGGKEKFLEKVNREGVCIARRVAKREVLVAGDVGPTGEFLKPYGEWEEEDFQKVFYEQINILVEEGVDLIVLETFSDIRELKIALDVAKDISDLPVMASMSFEKGKKGYRTIMGVSIKEMVEELEGADVIGANCGSLTPWEMAEVIEEMHRYTDLPILAKPNAGKSMIKKGEVVYEVKAEEFAEGMMEVIKKGAKLVGGCCGTNEDYIKKLSEKIKQWEE